MRFSDLHTHTKLCKHAVGELTEYFQTAAAQKISWYGISDHYP